ncbi:hypothetical protein ACFL9S_15060 [Erwinia sp. AnSW2-5]|uniref:hypothetical protein n=1 Tax=Erwinia sp. AnSW2-5 TaxID=3367692 RepID=UPI00385D9CB1
MPAGTIALTNNSSAATGTGTSFDTELSAGDFLSAVVGQVRYTLGIKSVDSVTGITLIRPFNGPSASGLAWTPIPRDVLVDTTAQIAADQGLVIRGFVLDKANWQQVFSEEEDITVTLPDGSQFQGPSWRKISELLATLDVGSITELAAEIHADADQVATDKPIILQAADDAIAANNAAQQAKEGTQTANAAAQQAKADATTQAGIAKTEADRAKTEADRAAASNPDNSLLKVNNLSDVNNTATARGNISAAKSGANSDITKISGLTTPLEISQGGGGANSASGIRSNLNVPIGVDKQMITAWVSFSVNPTTFAITIFDSFNVSSVTRASAGAYYVNFANSMLNANYAAIGMVRAPNTVVAAYTGYSLLNDTKTLTQVVVRSSYSTGTSAGAFDPSEFTVYIIGGK